MSGLPRGRGKKGGKPKQQRAKQTKLPPDNYVLRPGLLPIGGRIVNAGGIVNTGAMVNFLMVQFRLHHLTLLLLVWRRIHFMMLMALYVHQCALLRLITMLVLYVYVLWNHIL